MRPIFERRSGMLCVLSLIHILWFPLSLFSLFPSLAASSGSWLLFPNSPSPFIILLEFPMSSSPPTPLSLPQPIVHNFPSTPSLPSSLLSDLLQASHVLVSWDAAAPPLTSVNSGLYQVLSHSPHFFTLHLGSRTDTVYVHRLKTAVMTPSTPTATLPPCCRPPSSILRSSSTSSSSYQHVHFADYPPLQGPSAAAPLLAALCLAAHCPPARTANLPPFLVLQPLYSFRCPHIHSFTLCLPHVSVSRDLGGGAL